MAVILTIDDSPSMRQMVSCALKGAGHDVIEALHGQDGLDKAKATKVDLILSEINKHNISVKKESIINGRALTNIGTYRAYIKAYLKNNKYIHDNMTFLVRQLSPTENGLPIQIYVFSNNTNWIEYEEIQSDIFDHLLSVLNQFELKIYQYPSGNDLSKIKSINDI